MFIPIDQFEIREAQDLPQGAIAFVPREGAWVLAVSSADAGRRALVLSGADAGDLLGMEVIEGATAMMLPDCRLEVDASTAAEGRFESPRKGLAFRDAKGLTGLYGMRPGPGAGVRPIAIGINGTDARPDSNSPRADFAGWRIAWGDDRQPVVLCVSPELLPKG